MIFKRIIFLSILFFNTMASFGQTVKEQVEKAAKDPKTQEHAAKADVYLHRHNIGADSLKGIPPQSATSANKKKKKSCYKTSKNKQ